MTLKEYLRLPATEQIKLANESGILLKGSASNGFAGVLTKRKPHKSGK